MGVSGEDEHCRVAADGRLLDGLHVDGDSRGRDRNPVRQRVRKILKVVVEEWVLRSDVGRPFLGFWFKFARKFRPCFDFGEGMFIHHLQFYHLRLLALAMTTLLGTAMGITALLRTSALEATSRRTLVLRTSILTKVKVLKLGQV